MSPDTLYRPDLTLRASELDVLDVVEQPWKRGRYEQDEVYLVQPHRAGRYCGAPMQAVQTTDDYDPEYGPSYLFIPLEFGPTQEDV
jgi:hypothetical protein